MIDPARRIAPFLLLVGAALVASQTPAEAKAPAGGMTAEDLVVKAKEAEADRARRDSDKNKDPVKELISGYGSAAIAITEWTKLTDIVNNTKDEALQPYRKSAVEAIVRRFETADKGDPTVRKLRRDIADSVIDLMKAPSTDETGLHAIEYLLAAWWPQQLKNSGFVPKAKQADRVKALKKIRPLIKD